MPHDSDLGKHIKEAFHRKPVTKDALAQFDANWNESKHPREETGKFTSGGGSGGGKAEKQHQDNEEYLRKRQQKGQLPGKQRNFGLTTMPKAKFEKLAREGTLEAETDISPNGRVEVRWGKTGKRETITVE